MKKNAGGTWRRIRGLGIVRLPRVALLVMALAVPAGIPLAIPGPASAQGANSDLLAGEGLNAFAFLPVTASSAQAGTTRVGTGHWGFNLFNLSQTTVTNPSVSVASGYDPTQYTFSWNNQPVTAFPVTDSQASLAPAGVISDGLDSNVPVTYTLGFDSTRRVTPPVIPVRGGNQKVTMTVTLRDARYAQGQNVYGAIIVALGSNLPGVSVVSTTNPRNLNQGEQLQPPPGPTPGALWQWKVAFLQLNKTYRFSAVIHVPNASGRPFNYRPFVSIAGIRNEVLCSECSGSSVMIPDATLDGNVPGSGSATFSVKETTDTWEETYSPEYAIIYMGTS